MFPRCLAVMTHTLHMLTMQAPLLAMALGAVIVAAFTAAVERQAILNVMAVAVASVMAEPARPLAME